MRGGYFFLDAGGLLMVRVGEVENVDRGHQYESNKVVDDSNNGGVRLPFIFATHAAVYMHDVFCISTLEYITRRLFAAETHASCFMPQCHSLYT